MNAGIFRSASLNFSLTSHQLFHLVCRLLGSCPGRVLGAVGLGTLPLTALSGVPELALQLFRSSQKAVSEELLRRGLKLFRRTF